MIQVAAVVASPLHFFVSLTVQEILHETYHDVLIHDDDDSCELYECYFSSIYRYSLLPHRVLKYSSNHFVSTNSHFLENFEFLLQRPTETRNRNCFRSNGDSQYFRLNLRRCTIRRRGGEHFVNCTT